VPAHSKFTPETRDKILLAIRAGSYVETAAAYAGIGKSTLHEWLKRGANEKAGDFRDFSLAVEQAIAQADVRDITIIANAAQKGIWQAAAWRLERKHPQQWARRHVLQVGSEDGMLKTQEIDLANLSDRELNDLDRLLRKGRQAHPGEEEENV